MAHIQQIKERTGDLLERAEKAARRAQMLREQNEMLVARARRLTMPAEFEKLRDEVYGPAEM
jgi:uncharacterized protein (DUF3084 family)